jgi:glyoxylase-like metal-dependent hydrolase (beta-lactamase superfamily II)
MGDIFFFRESFPFIDLEAGGSIDGVIAAVDRALTIANDRTRIIPGHGPIGTRADLAAYGRMLADIRARVAAGIRTKRTLAQIKATRPAAAYGMADGYIKPDEFVETVYNSLLHPPVPSEHGRDHHHH